MRLNTWLTSGIVSAIPTVSPSAVSHAMSQSSSRIGFISLAVCSISSRPIGTKPQLVDQAML